MRIKEHIDALECPRCGEKFIHIPPDYGYVIIDNIKYLTHQAVCDLLEVVSRERDRLKESHE